MGQAQTVDNINDMRQLRLLALHILETSWCVEKEVLHTNFGPHRTSRWYDFLNLTSTRNELGSMTRTIHRRQQSQDADRSDRGQGFTTKTKRPNPKEVCLIFYLTGRMTTQGQFHLIVGNSMTIISDLNLLKTSFLNLNGNLARARVNSIFYQLFDHASRTFNDLSCCDLVCQHLWQFNNMRHLSAPFCIYFPRN